VSCFTLPTIYLRGRPHRNSALDREYGLDESAARADELAAQDDHNGAALVVTPEGL
jgi:hypothetical protein